ncbi:phosphate ABC transporter permease [Psychromonas sp. CNPT3]|uniref:ABC transporter permease subunit n=1 Tax=Psychromonas sp. CNPT3 TaxID=314282 RepID=UPI00006E42D1|nr:ABC transporter permease subunit [Psychromonas sp. CNPT3]AGH79990.1 phosphate ABC transporter permease [Psychromonas sp. CNPT3]
MPNNHLLKRSGCSVRLFKDKFAEYTIKLGGVLVLATLILIFAYLLYVVYPIFKSPSIEQRNTFKNDQEGITFALGLDEYNDIAYRFNSLGVNFFKTSGELNSAEENKNNYNFTQQAISFGQLNQSRKMAVFGFKDGSISLLEVNFKLTYKNNQREITPQVLFPFLESSILIDAKHQPIVKVSMAMQEDRANVISVTKDGRGFLTVFEASENFMTQELEWDSETVSLGHIPSNIDNLLISSNLQYAYIRSLNKLYILDISDISNIKNILILDINEPYQNVTDITFLSGGTSVLVANSNGVISQWFNVRDNGERKFTKIRTFSAEKDIVDLVSELNRKGFLSVSKNGMLTVFHATGGTKLLEEPLDLKGVKHLSIASRYNAFIVSSDTQYQFYNYENEYPEISWAAIWENVWYEGYSEPDLIWQSTSGADDFEPKFSLMPLAFGTIKAAFYAMLFAVPLAIGGAIYTAYFMTDRLRSVVKPSVEIMEALPTVILGFLAGLWLAPFIETHLPAVFLLMIALPLSALAVAALCQTLPNSIQEKLGDGMHIYILIPTLLIVSIVVISSSSLLEDLFFNGDARAYVNDIFGFDQRNSLVVGIAMGFAVIPTIFSITEDAVFSVPKHLTQGSLALGATKWQTLIRVVLLTASPGIFSAIMMGLGRAVGETMIVLMATGNTPIMDFNIFSGMRTLAANIAVEMPEAEIASSHYRILFLAAFVLFVLTFIFNTIAEFVRQKLREKYSSI